MASTYTSNSGVEKPGIGDQSGEWGTTVNTNMDILDRAINGVGVITLSGTTHTLTTTDGALSDGQYKVLVLSGSPSGTNTITISPNDQDKLYFVVNSSGQTATFSQGSGANVSVVNGDTKIIYADGAGSGAAVTEFASEVDALEGITAGTVSASKAVIVDANKDITGFRNVTLTGELDAGSLDVSGNADIDGTLEADAITLDGTAITTTATLSTGISNGNLPVFTTGVADDDFLRVDGTSIEGRSASEVLSDIGGQASLTFGISNTNAVKIDSASVADDEYARFTASGLESRSTAEVLSDIGASPVAGSSSIVTTGALDAGSITSGFGAIDNGSSAITTTGVITGGTVEATTDTAAGDNAAIGYTAAEGLILTGQGSTSDVTIKNDADATVLSIPTGTTKVGIGLTNPTGQFAVSDGTRIAEINPHSSGTFIGNRSNHDVLFQINAAEKMRITTSGNVGIGTTSPTGKLTVSSDIDVLGSNFANVEFTGASVNGSGVYTGLDSGGGYVVNVRDSGYIGFSTTNAERMRIDSGGNVSVGTTSAVSNARLAVERIGGVGNEAAIGFTSSGTAKWKIGNNASDSFVVYTPSNVGVYINSGATSWTATSDERLKNITGNIENALDAVQTLRAVKFTWIADDENKSQVGLIAQDVQAVLPEVITEDAEGYLGIRYTETIPLLVAAIQEQQTTIEALEARITALEAG